MKQKMMKLSEHSSYLQFGDNDRPNIALVKGNDRFIVIDAGNSKAHAELFLAESGLSGCRNGSVFFTHKHWDHICGAEYFDLPVFSSEYTAAKVTDMKKIKWDEDGILKAREANVIPEFTKNNMLEEQRLASEGDREFRMKVPDFHLSPGSILTMNLGGITCKCVPLSGNHTEGQYGIFVPEDRVFFIGDVLWPFMDCTQTEWHYSLAAFKKLKKELMSFDAQWYVESHADPVEREFLERWLSMMIYAMEFVRKGRGTAADAFASMPADMKCAMLGYEELIMDSITNCTE